VVAKFYRPQRWSEAQIEEEHAFAHELANREIPVVAPSHEGAFGGFIFAVYPRRGGRTPELDNPKVLEWIGRFMGRIHAVGATKKFVHRESLTPKSFGHDARAYLLATSFIPADVLDAWKAITQQALQLVDACYERAGQREDHPPARRLPSRKHPVDRGRTPFRRPRRRAHGARDAGPVDAALGRPRRDVAAAARGAGRLRAVHGIRSRELNLLEPLRTLRLIHYSAWIGRRWDDPAFPAAFPWFNTQRFWQDKILELREQIALMQEEPLTI
jgi:Ser/Thr protein kinase RdoA (MazF antagonist)